MPDPIVRTPLDEKAKFQLSILLEFKEELRAKIEGIRDTCLHDMQEVFPEIRKGWKKCIHCGCLRVDN